MTNGTGRRHAPAARAHTRTAVARSAEADLRVARLVAAAREDGDRRALDLLVAEHLGLVERIARRHAARREQVDDLVQEGAVGLLKAIRRFQPGRGAPFEAYAAALVDGEIRHHLRDGAASLRLPEPVLQLRARLRRLAAGKAAATGREPGIAELASLAGVTEEVAREATSAGVVPLEHDVPVVETGLRGFEERVALEGPLGRLDAREREVVYLRFFVDLTQADIGRRIGISQMHVSRLLRGALEKMRADIGGEHM